MDPAGALRTYRTKTASRHTESMVNLLAPPDVCRRNRTFERLGIQLNPALRRDRIFVQELEAETGESGAEKIRKGLHATLGTAVEESVAAAQVGRQWMLNTTAVP